MSARDFARCIEMAFNGTKSAYPAMQPADAFLRDFDTMVRTLVAGAVSPSPKPRRSQTQSQSQEIRPHKIGRSQMSTMTINGRVAPLPDDLDALLIDVVQGRSRPHRHQAGMRGRRLRRLHRAGGWRAGGELPDAGARRGGQIRDHGRRHRR